MSLYCHVFGNVPATYPLTHHVNPPPLPPKKHTSARFLSAVRSNLCQPWAASFLLQVACYYSNFDVLPYYHDLCAVVYLVTHFIQTFIAIRCWFLWFGFLASSYWKTTDFQQQFTSCCKRLRGLKCMLKNVSWGYSGSASLLQTLSVLETDSVLAEFALKSHMYSRL